MALVIGIGAGAILLELDVFNGLGVAQAQPVLKTLVSDKLVLMDAMEKLREQKIAVLLAQPVLKTLVSDKLVLMDVVEKLRVAKCVENRQKCIGQTQMVRK